MIESRKVANTTKGMSDIWLAASPMNRIRGLSNINTNGLPNNNGVHAVPMSEIPDMAMIGSAVGSIRLIKGRSFFLIKGGSIDLTKVALT